MAGEFLIVEFETDERTLVDKGIDHWREKYPGYEPNDSDPEVVQLEAVGPMAANAAQAAVRVSPAVFRSIGTNLFGIPYASGIAAVGSVSFQVLPTDTVRVIPAGTAVDVDGHEFTTNEETTDLPNPLSHLVSNVPVTASTVGTVANDLTGDTVAMVSSLVFVQDVVLDGPTTGGSDADTDETYQDNVSTELRLTTRALVTGPDYELFTLKDPGVDRAWVVTNAADRTVDITATDPNGDPVSEGVKDRLQEGYAPRRLSNWSVNLIDASYTIVSVSYSVKIYPTHDEPDVLSRIDSYLESWLAPSTYGKPKNFGDPGTTGFVNDPVIRKNKLIDLIGDIDGVDYVADLSISAPGSIAGPRDGDVTLPGTVALPRPGFMTGTVV